MIGALKGSGLCNRRRGVALCVYLFLPDIVQFRRPKAYPGMGVFCVPHTVDHTVDHETTYQVRRGGEGRREERKGEGEEGRVGRERREEGRVGRERREEGRVGRERREEGRFPHYG